MIEVITHSNTGVFTESYATAERATKAIAFDSKCNDVTRVVCAALGIDKAVDNRTICKLSDNQRK